MGTSDQVLARMDKQLAAWQAADDRRFIFLDCYIMMTRNVLAAIQANAFEDTPWVATLMENFAGYYFQALEAYENGSSGPADVWGIAFQAAQHPHVHAVQSLVLGVNAHINYDLVFALSDLLAAEWAQVSPEQHQMRYRDYCQINEIINNTIDAVRSQIIDRYDPLIGEADKLLGPVDKWMTYLLLSEWREEVWKHATRLLDPAQTDDRNTITQQVHKLALARAQDILGKGSLAALVEFL